MQPFSVATVLPSAALAFVTPKAPRRKDQPGRSS